MQRVLQREHLELAEQPEGKRIAWVRVVRDEVFVEDEIWPTWLNWFHATTREAVVRRELLFEAGAPYVEARVEETMRNLRGMAIFALVRIVAVRVPEPGAVGVVVHTRDLWSLRAETAFDGSTIVDQFLGRLVERNFLGRNTALAVDVTWTPNNYRLGQEYISRRVFSSTVQLQEAVGVVMNRERNRAEGSTWEASLGEPFYNLRQRFSWKGAFSYADTVTRRMDRLAIRPFPFDRPDRELPHTQQVYHSRVALSSLLGYLRLGEHFKQTWGLGWDVRSGRYNINAETMLEPELAAAFKQRILPKERRELGPLFTYEILIPQFQKFVNLASYGVTENVRIGPSAGLTVRAPLRAFGSNTKSWVFSTTAGYILAPAGWLLQASAGGRTRYEEDRLVDQRFEALVRGATPVLFDWFRLVTRVSLDARRNDTANTYVTLGASNGLRGYESQAFSGSGANRLLANFELRTMPIKWQAVQVGGVVFYDTGSVYTKVDSLHLHHAVGVGLRVLLPQLNRTPFSIDGGRYLDRDYASEYSIIPTIKDGQVVPLTAVEDPL
jgi:hypothetical protein